MAGSSAPDGSELADNELVDRFIAGDAKAFSTIVERHRARLTFVARRYTNNDTDAQDVVQEAFFRASCNLHRYRRESALSTWLHRLVMNSGYDFLNHRANREHASLDAEVVEADRNVYCASDPFRGIDKRIAVTNAMLKLREDQRFAIYMTDIVGYPVAEVARHAGVAEGTIKSRRARARATLREEMGGAMEAEPASAVTGR